MGTGLFPEDLEAPLRARTEQCLGGACENIQSIAVGDFDHDIIVTHDISMLATDAASIVKSVIGVDSIHVPAAEEAFDHAD